MPDIASVTVDRCLPARIDLVSLAVNAWPVAGTDRRCLAGTHTALAPLIGMCGTI